MRSRILYKEFTLSNKLSQKQETLFCNTSVKFDYRQISVIDCQSCLIDCQVIYNDFNFDDVNFPLFLTDELFLLTNENVFPLNSDITFLNLQLESLNLDICTQSLCIEVEKIKRQKLNVKFKHVKLDLISQRRVIDHLRSEMKLIRESHSTMRILYERKLMYLRTVSYRCLTRIHQILISVIPHMFLSARNVLICHNFRMSCYERFISY